jgi:YhcH/YjgK/YiaL family protein
MIFDNIKNAQTYFELGDNFKKAFEFLQNKDLSRLGKYEIEGDNIYVNIQEYQTKLPQEGKLEAHRKYIDIQFIIKGEEKLGCLNIEETFEDVPYNFESDLEFLKAKNPENINFAKAKEGDFLIFFPHDAHMPGICTNVPKYLKKAVIKIRI